MEACARTEFVETLMENTNASATPAMSQQKQAMLVAMWMNVATTHEFVAAVAVAIHQAPMNANVNQDSQSPPVVIVRTSMSVPIKAFARVVAA